MNIRINRHTIETDKVSREHNIVVFADSHLTRKLLVPKKSKKGEFKFSKQLDELLKKLYLIKYGISTDQNNEPSLNELQNTTGTNNELDAIVMTGDNIDSLNFLNFPENCRAFANFLQELANITPVYMNFDWHDYLYLAKKGLFSKQEVNGAEIRHKTNYLFTKYLAILDKIANLHLFQTGDNSTLPISEEMTISAFTTYNTATIKKETLLQVREKLVTFSHNLAIAKEKFNLITLHNLLWLFNSMTPALKEELGFENIDLAIAGHLHSGLMPKKTKGIINYGINPTTKIPNTNHNIQGLYQGIDYSVIAARGFVKIPQTAPIIFHPINSMYNNDIELVKIKKSI